MKSYCACCYSEDEFLIPMYERWGLTDEEIYLYDLCEKCLELPMERLDEVYNDIVGSVGLSEIRSIRRSEL